MNGYENLQNAIISDLSKHYDVTQYDYRFNPQLLNPLLCRSHLYKLMLIELHLHEHRIKFKNSVLDLDGAAALHHLVYLKTNWAPQKIREMSYSDQLFALLDELVPDKLSDKAQSFLQEILNSQRLLKTDLASYTGWQIGSGDRYLKNE